ncbi:hypothetical protein M413DRAFT_443222 [Hebeloma cylindrosporum]|uniref:BTB domain-containing protein n=1 Tax=Hebeloma cylindrosporum TaxID=76867 RepID=A0A0C3CKA1_HEBCY|nr:hypothetical protein M413DRAFT_443222 [Hebeloma cylindrosporum h7]
MSENPPLKRQRTDDAQEDAETQPLQRSRFWFDDGNVILQAENTQFRVHRSVLSLHSNVFKDMFSVPQPTDPTTMSIADGCPVITLSDKASDLEYVLSVFYENIRAQGMLGLMPVDLVVAIIRLGKKYEIDYLCDEGLKRLRVEFPNTLEKWDTSCHDYSQIKFDGQWEISKVLQLCCELSIPSCLPTAYLLFVTRCELESIMNMFGGSTVDRQIIVQSVRGRDKLIRAYHEVLQGWTEEKLLYPSQHCSSILLCSREKVLACRSCLSIEDGNMRPLDPWDETDFDLCKPCLDSLRVAYEKAREKFWADLPSFFGLLPWEKLKDFDA